MLYHTVKEFSQPWPSDDPMAYVDLFIKLKFFI